MLDLGRARIYHPRHLFLAFHVFDSSYDIAGLDDSESSLDSSAVMKNARMDKACEKRDGQVVFADWSANRVELLRHRLDLANAQHLCPSWP